MAVAAKKRTRKTKAEGLLKKISAGHARIGVVGLGYVGLPIAQAFAARGFQVTGIDIDEAKVRKINSGLSYISDVKSDALKGVVRKGRLKAVSDFSIMADLDIVIVCVPTPLNRVKDPDISHIVAATAWIKDHLHSGQLIILESTTYPGTTEEVILPSLEESGLKVGKDFYLCFSPERIDPGNKDFEHQSIPKVVGGVTAKCTKLAAALYSKISPKVVPVSSARTAEMTKLLENTFRIVNIGLINELTQAASNLNINIWEAIEAAKTKPFGFMPFYPGPGIGGHCIGVDPVYLSWKARLHGSNIHFIELARRVNAEMPRYVVSKAVYTLNQFRGKAISRSKVMLLGVSYKKDIDDTRESPALNILEDLAKLGARISYHDPFVKSIHHNNLSLRSQPLTAAALKKQDLIILTTDHSKFNHTMIVKHSGLIFDTRNALKGLKGDHIVRL